MFISEQVEYMQHVYKMITSGYNYSFKGLRRFRVYVYIYHFGCIHIGDMPFLFPDDLKQVLPAKEILNTQRSMLNYLSKEDFLEKLNEGFYTLKTKGLKELYEHLKELSLPDTIDFQSFSKNFIKKSMHLSHSSKTGRAVNTFVQSYDLKFLYEPIIDYEGNILPGSFFNSSSRAFLPDAMLFGDNNELYYIEADSSTERINSVIAKKLSQYHIVFKANAFRKIMSTLHFSIWNKEYETTFPLFFSKELNDFYNLFRFFKNEINFKMDFNEYISFLLTYNGEFEPVLSASSFIKNLGINNEITESTFRKVINTTKMYENFNNSFFKRQSGFFKIAENNTDINHSLLDGNRLIVTPLNANNNLLNCIYLEHNYSSFLHRFLYCFFDNKISIISSFFLRFFDDKTTGDSYCFRNVFHIKTNDKYSYIVVENISDDLGGRIRIKKFLSRIRSHSIRNIHLICLFNSKQTSVPESLVSDSTILYDQIDFVSYENFLF